MNTTRKPPRTYKGVVLTKRLRKCPMCQKKHRWPTEDKLCYVCEGEWVELAHVVFEPRRPRPNYKST